MDMGGHCIDLLEMFFGNVVIDPEPVNTYQAEIEEFSAAILNDRASSIDGALGLRSQKILAACYESARLGRTVEVV